MNTRGLVSELMAKGHQVTFYNRPDGGIRITQIDGMTFAMTGGEGNQKAREILGEGQLSERQKSQRYEAREKTIESHRVLQGFPKLTTSEKIRFRKMNRVLRQLKQKTIGSKQARQSKGAHKNSRELFRAMKNIVRHASDIAYRKGVEAMSAWLSQFGIMPRVQAFLNDPKNRDLISEMSLQRIKELAYDVNNHTKDEAQADDEGVAFLEEGRSRLKLILGQYKKIKKI